MGQPGSCRGPYLACPNSPKTPRTPPEPTCPQQRSARRPPTTQPHLAPRGCSPSGHRATVGCPRVPLRVPVQDGATLGCPRVPPRVPVQDGGQGRWEKRKTGAQVSPIPVLRANAVPATRAEKMPALGFGPAPAPAVPLRSPYFTEVSHPHVTETKSGEEGTNICQEPLPRRHEVGQRDDAAWLEMRLPTTGDPHPRLGTPTRPLLALLQQKIKIEMTLSSLDQARDRLAPSKGLKQP